MAEARQIKHKVQSVSRREKNKYKYALYNSKSTKIIYKFCD